MKDKKQKKKKKHTIKVEKEKKQKQKETQHLILKKLKGNALLIKKLMFERNVKGDYRDYIVLSGTRLYHYFGIMELSNPDGKEFSVGKTQMLLVHKKEMRKFFSEETSLKFWHPKLGRLGATLRPPKKN